jgi:chemotaxis protein methyltransferase CheR
MTAISRKGQDASLVQGEFTMTEEDFRRIGAILYADSGISLPEGKVALVYSRLAKRLRGLGLRSFREYCSLIGEDAGASERKTMLMALTTNVTRFFREPHHFEHLTGMIRDHWMRGVKAGGRLRIWSAGCSTGEEPYSIAMALLACMPDALSLDVRILATDIDGNVLEKAKSAAYAAEAASQIPQQYRSGFDTDAAGRVVISAEVRQLVRFAELNLMSNWPMKGQFEAIFCRNVAIYFDEATQARLWSNFGKKLSSQGRLYIGHSERVSSPGFVADGQTVYRRAGDQA